MKKHIIRVFAVVLGTSLILGTVYMLPTPAHWRPQVAAFLCLCDTRSAEELSAFLGNDFPTDIEGILLPVTQPGDIASISGEEEVIGVEVGPQFRAYRLTALAEFPECHIVNDVVNGIPVTLTYCDLTDNIRALTDCATTRTPLPLRIGGFIDGEMQLLLQGVRFPQRSTLMPFADYPFERTKWSAWKKAHPSTDIYTGVVANTSGDSNSSYVRLISNGGPAAE